jgi:hypothetical protein
MVTVGMNYVKIWYMVKKYKIVTLQRIKRGCIDKSVVKLPSDVALR